MRRAKTTRPEEDNSLDEEQQIENSGGTVKNKAKKDNLKKRQKYDPRKAIAEAKRKEEQEKEDGDDKGKASKSAFPKGFLNPDA